MTPTNLVRMGFGDFEIRINGQALRREQLTTSEVYSSERPTQFIGHFLDIHTEVQDNREKSG